MSRSLSSDMTAHLSLSVSSTEREWATEASATPPRIGGVAVPVMGHDHPLVIESVDDRGRERTPPERASRASSRGDWSHRPLDHSLGSQPGSRATSASRDARLGLGGVGAAPPPRLSPRLGGGWAPSPSGGFRASSRSGTGRASTWSDSAGPRQAPPRMRSRDSPAAIQVESSPELMSRSPRHSSVPILADSSPEHPPPRACPSI